MTKSKNVREALDRIRDAVDALDLGGSPGSIEYPRIENGPVELVLAFNNHEFIKLEGPDEAPYFSSHGPLTDLQFNELPGTWVATTFPVDPAKFGETETWPPAQVEPFDAPPVDPPKSNDVGNSKQSYYFNDREDWFVTAGPSIPRITRTKEGGAQFWVGSIGLISQGGGKFEGARGVTTYVGSGYFDKWPDSFPEQVQLLRAGFTALIGTYVKVVLRHDVGDAPESKAPVETGEEYPEYGGTPQRGGKRSRG
ncbi:MAG: hypothetical protein LC802_22755 [Acidobacteria bacterium]|nr:hypothetical protein [Acidobacteriota bacterium]